MVHTFNSSTWDAEAERQRQVAKFEASLIYRVSSKIARAAQRNLISSQNKTKQTN